MASFRPFHFHATEAKEAKPAAAPFGFGIAGEEVEAPAEPVRPMKTFHNDESAARSYMSDMWEQENEGPLFEITAPERPQIVPDLRLASVQESPETKTRLLHFDQTLHDLPVLGAKAVVELDQNRNLVGIDAAIADAPDVSPVATISAADAIARVKELVQTDFGNIPAPVIHFHKQDDGWHLIYEVRSVPAAPPEFRTALQEEEGHGLGPSPQRDRPLMTYLVDAHDGKVLTYYTESAWLDDLPVECTGLDELQTQQTFFGFQNGAAFELRDPVRRLRTLDFSFGHLINSPAPTKTVSNAGFDFADKQTAAVSAHVNATHVFDFFNDVLKRDSVDDKGMELVSVVNCTYEPPGKSWKNAVWYDKRMWYGQVANAAGKFDSYSRYLDVIAHELTHGVTETTAGLKYLNESGALNESFSDIFGIIVKNLNGPNPDDPRKWDWQLGTGLGKNGGPLRDLSDPTRTGHPAHMNDYKQLPINKDAGGVHTNSSIHNKAAFHVLTAEDAAGKLIFEPKRAALLYYLTLTRLTAFATFSDTLSTLQNVIRTLWAGRPAEAQKRIDAVVAAYGKAGIQ